MGEKSGEQSVSVTTETVSAVRYVEVGAGEVGQRLDNFLMRVLKRVPKSHIYRLLRKGEVRVNGKRAKPDQRLVLSDRVRIPPMRVEAAETPAQPTKSLQRFINAGVIYEDRDLLILNKPAGVAVHGGSGLSHGVIEALRAARPELTELELVHRLDRETSGCLILAKRRAVLRELHSVLREREMQKHYLALVCGRWTLGKKVIELPLVTNQKQGGERMVKVHQAGQSAVTTFAPLKHFGRLATLMDVTIGTGRTHQIRVHAAYAGHPVAGDEKYGNYECNDALKPHGLKRMFLHAASLQFAKPGTGEPFSISAPLSEELEAVLANLESKTR